MLLVENCFSLGPLFGHAIAEPALHSPCLAECSVRALLLQTGALRELHPVEGARVVGPLTPNLLVPFIRFVLAYFFQGRKLLLGGCPPLCSVPGHSREHASCARIMDFGP